MDEGAFAPGIAAETEVDITPATEMGDAGLWREPNILWTWTVVAEQRLHVGSSRRRSLMSGPRDSEYHPTGVATPAGG